MSTATRPSGPRWAAALIVLALLATLGACSVRSGVRHTTSQAPPPATVTLEIARGVPGTYVTDGAGRALYMWDADRGGRPTCYGSCAAAWPPLTVTGQATAGSGLQASLVGSVTRQDGTHQVTYGGWPLYYYAADIKPGQLSGQGNTGFGAVWWVLSAAGKPLPSEPVTTTG